MVRYGGSNISVAHNFGATTATKYRKRYNAVGDHIERHTKDNGVRSVSETAYRTQPSWWCLVRAITIVSSKVVGYSCFSNAIDSLDNDEPATSSHLGRHREDGP